MSIQTFYTLDSSFARPWPKHYLPYLLSPKSRTNDGVVIIG